MIGISVRNVDDQDMTTQKFLLEPVKELVRVCRECSAALVVLGGPGYSMFPDAALDYLGADLGVCGEGEITFPALLEALERRQDPATLPAVNVRGRGSRPAAGRAPDLDLLPLPDDGFWSEADPGDAELWAPIQTRRGCALDCSYCSTASIEGRSVRWRTPRRMAEYIGRLADMGFRRFYFVDNTFNLPASYALELCRQIADLRLGISWRCIVYPHNLPEELIAAMAEAGCVEASLGFESGAPAVLHGMNKRFEPEDVRRVADRLAAWGIRRMGFLMLGGPGETRETVKQSLHFAHSLRLDMLKTSVGIRIYPHTPLARLAADEGLIAPDDDLLFPRFYLRPELKDWISGVVTPGVA